MPTIELMQELSAWRNRAEKAESKVEDLELKLTGRLQNKDGKYDPILVQLSYLTGLEGKCRDCKVNPVRLWE